MGVNDGHRAVDRGLPQPRVHVAARTEAPKPAGRREALHVVGDRSVPLAIEHGERDLLLEVKQVLTHAHH